MKKIFPPVCLAVLFSLSSLFAQEVAPTVPPENEPSVPKAPHVKDSGWHGYRSVPLGTKDAPSTVTVSEYCAFLNTKAPQDRCWAWSDYYDPSFMITDWTYYTPLEKYCIYRSGRSPHYIYTVIPGKEGIIIDYVLSFDLLKQFNEWRENPTTAEICEYLNEKIAATYLQDASEKETHLAKALAIRNRYPSSIVEGFTYASKVITIVGSAENPQDYTFGSIAFSSVDDDPLLAKIPIRAICPKEVQYYRETAYPLEHHTSDWIHP